MVWTIRGAPRVHPARGPVVCRCRGRAVFGGERGKRIFDAAKPLKAAGISSLEAADPVAAAMRSVVTRLRFCRACNATHLYEMPLRLAALRAGLELEADTSPPVVGAVRTLSGPPRSRSGMTWSVSICVRSAPRHQSTWRPTSTRRSRTSQPIGPAALAGYRSRECRDGSCPMTRATARRTRRTTRLLGPFDLFLQARDRPLLVDDTARRHGRSWVDPVPFLPMVRSPERGVHASRARPLACTSNFGLTLRWPRRRQSPTCPDKNGGSAGCHPPYVRANLSRGTPSRPDRPGTAKTTMMMTTDQIR